MKFGLGYRLGYRLGWLLAGYRRPMVTPPYACTRCGQEDARSRLGLLCHDCYDKDNGCA